MTQQRVIYDLEALAHQLHAQGKFNDCGELVDPDRYPHPQIGMRRLADAQQFTILAGVPQSMGDCWWFWVEYSTKPNWPSHITEAEWLPIGSV
jgi:hypothetical protein